MTPLASRLFRHGDDFIRGMLVQCQFVEISSIIEMAQEMGSADVAAGCMEYSEFAQLPSPLTVVEFIHSGLRSALLCEQHGNELRYSAFFQIQPDAKIPDFRFATGFTLGTGLNSNITWANFEGEPDFENHGATMGEDDPRHKTARGISLLLEKALCILNQPGLVERHAQPTDKRIIREGRKANLQPPPAQWFVYKIRPGVHSGSGANGEGVGRPLHYVRKHFKPSAQKWIEGYWRGDLDIGLHLKWYSPQPHAKALT